MKIILVLLLSLFANFALADQVYIRPGSSITVGAQTTVSCVGDDLTERCGRVMSTNRHISTCSGRAMGSRCAVGSFRGICDRASNVGHSGSSSTCACQ